MQLLKRLLWILLSGGLFLLLNDLLKIELFLIYSIPGVLILAFGLPHGATDHMLSNFIKSRKVSGRVTPSFITAYLLIIFAYAVIWFFSPEIALLVFLLLSAYHFGETQWIRDEALLRQKLWVRVHNFSWGVFLLGALFTIHDQETLSFLSGLIDDEVASKSIYISKLWIVPMSFFITVVLSVLLYSTVQIFSQIVELIALITFFWVTELIYAFAIFFTLFHSRDTIKAMMRIINTEASSSFSWKMFYQQALPFTAISLIGIFLIILAINQLNPEIHLITLFFVMISLITAPHMWIIERFYSVSK